MQNATVMPDRFKRRKIKKEINLQFISFPPPKKMHYYMSLKYENLEPATIPSGLSGGLCNVDKEITGESLSKNLSRTRKTFGWMECSTLFNHACHRFW